MDKKDAKVIEEMMKVADALSHQLWFIDRKYSGVCSCSRCLIEDLDALAIQTVFGGEYE